MDDDVKELLGLIVRAGEVAARVLQKAAPPAQPIAVSEIPTSELIEKGIIPIPPDLAKQVAPVELPHNFRVGQPRFADSYPTKQRWFTSHARDELVQRYDVSPNIAYRTLMHVHRSIKEDKAVLLYRKANVDVYACDLFGRIGFVAADSEDGCLITFLPPESRDNGQIVNYPLVRARLEQFERSLIPRAPRAVSGWGAR